MSNAPHAAAAVTTTTTAATGPATRTSRADEGGGVFELLIILPLALAGLALAARAGVFRPRSVAGPPRLDHDESAGVLLLGFGAGFILWIAAQWFFLAPAAPTAVAPGPSTTPAVTTAPAPSESLPPAKMAVASSVPAIAAAAFVLLLNATTRRAGLQRLGLSPAQFRPGVRTGLIGSAIMVPLVFLAAIITEFAWRVVHYDHPRQHDLLRLMGESPSPLVTAVLIFSAVVIAPLWEEILFRGHLQTLITYALARLLSDPRQRGFDVVSPVTAQALDHTTAPASDPAPWIRWISITLTSLAFAVVHPAWTIPPIFFLSLCLGYAYERTGNLWTVMFMHAGFNTTSTLIYLLLVR